MTMHTAHEIHLVSRPVGMPVPEDFARITVDLPDPGPGQVLVRNVYVSVDPYMRARMNDVPSYVPPYQLGKPMDGGAIGEVIASESDWIKVGDTVVHGFGWRDLAVVADRGCTVVDESAAPRLSAFLGALGMPGLTAYVGLLDIAAMRPGDTVFVSGAAGAVGSLAGQIAKLRGAARVIGSAGSAEKVNYLTGELGFDEAFNYRNGSIRQQLRDAAPDGIDVYFDNVGGDHLTAAIFAARRGGRVALCGAIDVYNATEARPGPPNLAVAIGKRLSLRGFIVTDHEDRMPAFVGEMSGWLRDRRITFQETTVDGLKYAPAAFIGLLRGDNIGKMVVRV
jgi:NADPH-dependent curcumin reductase CurA